MLLAITISRVKYSTKQDITIVARILSNKLYCGYIVYGKSYKEDFLSKRVNNNDKSTYTYLKSDKEEAIVTEEEFDKVQVIKQRRQKIIKQVEVNLKEKQKNVISENLYVANVAKHLRNLYGVKIKVGLCTGILVEMLLIPQS